MSFKFTTEQLQAIANGDMDARNTFYFDNLDIIKRMAYCALRKERHPVVSVDDLIQGVYVDMDYFCHSVNKPVTDEYGIIFFLRWSFHLAPYGGLAYCRKHNPKITHWNYKCYDTTYTDNSVLRLDKLIDDGDENGKTFGDTIPDPHAGIIEQSEDYTAEYVKVFGKYLKPKMREVFALIMDGYDGTHIAEMLNLNRGTTYTRIYRLGNVFSKHYADIIKTLADYGIHAENILDRVPKRFYKTSENAREKHREFSRRYYARKRAERNGNGIA